MPSPDLPQPIYPNAPSGPGPQPQYDFGQRPMEPQGYGHPGGHYQPLPPGPPRRPNRGLQVALAAGAVVLIAAVITIVVLANKSGDNTANNGGQTSTSSTTTDSKKTNGPITTTTRSTAQGVDLATVKSTVKTQFSTFSSTTIDCIAQPLAADSRLFQAVRSSPIVVQSQADAQAYAQILTGCAGQDELTVYLTALLNTISPQAAYCVEPVTADWGRSEWTQFIASAITTTTAATSMNIFTSC